MSQIEVNNLLNIKNKKLKFQIGTFYNNNNFIFKSEVLRSSPKKKIIVIESSNYFNLIDENYKYNVDLSWGDKYGKVVKRKYLNGSLFFKNKDIAIICFKKCK